MHSYQNFRVGTGKFLIGVDVLNLLSDEITRYTKKPLVIGGPTSVDRILESQGPSLVVNNISPAIRKHTGECSRAWASFYTKEAEAMQCGAIIGIGGGKCIDLAKAVSTLSGLPLITIPTSIATCVATSSVCIMYTDDGVPDGSIAMNNEVDVVLADLDVIKTAPKRLLFAGVFDSIAKFPETIHNSAAQTYQACGLEKYICIENSRIIYDYLINESEKIASDYPNIENDEFKNLVLINLLHTSIVSGFSLGSNQLAIAHGIYDFIRRYFTRESRSSLHGEIVAVGILVQMAFNEESEDSIGKMEAMLKRTGIPTKLKDVGFISSHENITKLQNYLKTATNIKDIDDKKLLSALMSIV